MRSVTGIRLNLEKLREVRNDNLLEKRRLVGGTSKMVSDLINSGTLVMVALLVVGEMKGGERCPGMSMNVRFVCWSSSGSYRLYSVMNNKTVQSVKRWQKKF
jgi:hypothetical protein